MLFLSNLIGDSPNEDMSFPVLLDLYLVFLPITDFKFDLTSDKTIFPPASSASDIISSVLSPSFDSFKRNYSGILIVALAVSNHPPLAFTSFA